MKKYMKVLMVIMVTLALPVKAYADEINNSFSMKCSPSTVNPGDEISCTIEIDTDTKQLTAISANVSFEEGLEVVSFSKDNNFGIENGGSGYSSKDKKLAIYTEVEEAGKYTVGILKLKVKDTATVGTSSVTLTNIKVYYEDTIESKAGDVKADITIEEKAQEPEKTGLSDMEIIGGTLSWSFTSDRLEYTAEIEGADFGIKATPNNPDDTVKYYNDANLAEKVELDPNSIKFDGGEQGIMYISITVGEVKYSLLVLRKKTEEKLDNSLSSLIVDGKTVDLSKCVDDTCEVTVRDIKKYEYKALLTDSENFEFDDTWGPGEGINSGNSLQIKIVPKDTSSGATSRFYTVNVKESGTGSNSSVKPNSSSNVASNPGTSGISKFYVTLIMIASLVIGLTIYKKNVDTYE